MQRRPGEAVALAEESLAAPKATFVASLSGLLLGITGFDFFDFSSRGALDPSPQLLHEPGQTGRAHTHQPGVERLEPSVGPMPHMLGAGRERLTQVGSTEQTTSELLGAAGCPAPA